MAQSKGWWSLGAVGGLALAAGALGLAGCSAEAKPITAASSKYRPKDYKEPEAAPAPAAAGATATSGAKANEVNSSAPGSATGSAGKTPPAAAPTGDLAQALAVIAKLDQQAQSPPGNSQQEQLQNFLKIQQSRQVACERALTLNPDRETRINLIQSLYQIYQIYGEVGVPEAKVKLIAFSKSLSSDADPEIARFGRYSLFESRISQLSSQPLPEGKPILDEIKTLLAGDKGGVTAETLELAQTAVGGLMKNGLQTEGVEALEMLAAAAATDPKLAEQAVAFKDAAKIVGANLSNLLEDILSSQPLADQKMVSALEKLLTEVQPTPSVFATVQRITQVMEFTGHIEPAKACYGMLETKFKEVKEPEFAAAVAKTIASARTRLALVGQSLEVEGVTIDGKPFDWSPYQGKVVLLYFWITNSRECMQELPNVLANYDLFHGRGFEVVGINLDTNVKDVKEFFTLQGELPWTTVISPKVLDPKLAPKSLEELEMAAKCGVDVLPFVLLIGKDGKVDSLHVRGSKLKARLIALLGAPPATEIPADPTAPAAPPAGRPATPAPAAPAPAIPAPAAPAAPTAGKTGFVPPAALLMTQALLAADPPPAALPTAEDPAINPYKAKPGLTNAQLIDFVLKMLDKPKTIQSRAGFGDAVVEACDRVLQAEPAAKETEWLVAAESKLAVLHREACTGNDAADKRLMAFVEQLQSDMRPRIAREVAFFKLERKAIDAANLPLEEVPALLKELQDYLAKEKLSGKHLRLASSTVAAINRLASGDDREKHFASFGGTFAKSSDKELARYGKKLAKKPEAQESDLVGKPLELAGTTQKGLPFAWAGYRGKVVIVDFWATWCGPCRREMPNVKALFEKHKDRGFEVVGVSLDQDQEALATYIEENQIPWETLAGDDTQQLAEKYGVRAIPTMMLVDKTGKIVGVAHNLAALAPLAEKLLNGEAATPPPAK